MLHIDEKNRVIYFLAVGKEAGRDPYYQALYSIHFDGSDQRLLTPEDADHVVIVLARRAICSSMQYSTPTTPQVTVVRNLDGKVVMDVAHQDITRLVAAGWVPPTPIKVKARDGQTELYGFMFKPTNLDPTRKYPIVNYVYPGPQIGSCGGTHLHRRARRSAVARRARLRRRLHRRHGNALPLQGLP